MSAPATTEATRNGDGTYWLTGHKWFTPAADVRHLPGARRKAPGWALLLLPAAGAASDGSRNRTAAAAALRKDKLGNNANASSEVEHDGATAWLGRRGGPRASRPSPRWST